MNSEQFFIDNLNRLPKGIGGLAEDKEKSNLYWGLVLLSREVASLHQDQQQVLQALRQIAARIR